MDLDSELGAGSFGVVRRGVHLATGDACAIKCMENGAEHRLDEVRLQEELAHANVCRLFGYVLDAGKMFMALELCSGGDLDGLLRARAEENFSWVEVRTYLFELLSATDYIHSCGITHRDIKPSNVLLQESAGVEMCRVKLADFGLAARCAPGEFLDGCGTVPFMSPEQLKNSCNEKCDVWACGCILFQLVCGDYLVGSHLWEENRKARAFLFSSEYGD